MKTHIHINMLILRRRRMIDLEKQLDDLKSQGDKPEDIVIFWLELNNSFDITEAGFRQ